MVCPRPKTVEELHQQKFNQIRYKGGKRQQGVSRPSRNFDLSRPKIMEEFIQINQFANFVKEKNEEKVKKEKIKKKKQPVIIDFKTKEPILLEKDIKHKSV